MKAKNPGKIEFVKYLRQFGSIKLNQTLNQRE